MPACKPRAVRSGGCSHVAELKAECRPRCYSGWCPCLASAHACVWTQGIKVACSHDGVESHVLYHFATSLENPVGRLKTAAGGGSKDWGAGWWRTVRRDLGWGMLKT